MKFKLVEIRDKGTTIPALAFRLDSTNDQERWLIDRCGYYGSCAKPIFLCRLLDPSTCTSDPYDWPATPRTYRQAHLYICEHFDELEPGAIVDVQFILGESPAPKHSDRFSTEAVRHEY